MQTINILIIQHDFFKVSTLSVNDQMQSERSFVSTVFMCVQILTCMYFQFLCVFRLERVFLLGDNFLAACELQASLSKWLTDNTKSLLQLLCLNIVHQRRALILNIPVLFFPLSFCDTIWFARSFSVGQRRPHNIQICCAIMLRS